MTQVNPQAAQVAAEVVALVQQTDVWKAMEHLLATSHAQYAASHSSVANRSNTVNPPPDVASALRTRMLQGNPAPTANPVQAHRQKIAAQGIVQMAAVKCPSGALQRVRLDQNGNPNADDASMAMYRARGYRPRQYAGGVEDTGSAQLGLDIVRQHLPAGSEAVEPLLTEEMGRRLLGRSAPALNFDTTRSY
jgi:hypothetical protein